MQIKYLSNSISLSAWITFFGRKWISHRSTDQYFVQLNFFWSSFLMEGLEKGFEAQLTVIGSFTVAICMRNKKLHPSELQQQLMWTQVRARSSEAGRCVCVFCLLFSLASNNAVDRKTELVRKPNFRRLRLGVLNFICKRLVGWHMYHNRRDRCT